VSGAGHLAAERTAGSAVRAWTSAGGRLGADQVWAVVFILPYLAVFAALVAYPVAFGIWLGSNPDDYAALFRDPIYLETVWNTLVLLVVGVNLKLALALLLSGFFAHPSRWRRALLLVFILPWAVPAIPTFISFRWLLNGQWGLINTAIWQVFQVDGPGWLDTPGLAFASVLAAYVWKWLPFWTLILLAARMAVPQELYEAAAMDGARGWQTFRNVTFPAIGNLYLICTVLSTIWTLGDYNTVHFVSGGGPALGTHVLATLGIRDAFEVGQPGQGVAAVITALPLLVPLVVLLMRRIRAQEQAR
jgi:multiple sugar transport system permease protein